MVALWFGALFGLGSLAVRASLLESLVLSMSLDVLLPAAAPPLGMKSRLILALLLAAIGVAVGAILARRIARPKPVETTRRRSVGTRAAARQAREDAAAEADQAPTRRRPLTIEEDAPSGFDYDAAPLPGSTPAILDVTQIDFTPLPPETPIGDVVAGEAEPLLLDAHAAELTDDRQAFRVDMSAPYEAGFVQVAEPQPAPLNFDPPAESETFIEAEAVDAPLDLLAEHEIVVAEASTDQAEALQGADTIDGLRQFDCAAAPAPAPLGFEPEAEPETHFAESADEDRFEPEFAPQPLPVLPSVLLAQPPVFLEQSAGETKSGSRIETAELAELSPVELIERLALAMRQRQHRGPMPAALANAVSSLVELTPADVAVPQDAAAETVPCAEPSPHFAPFAATAEVQSFDVEVPEALPAAIAPEPVKLALPAALRPIDFGDYAEHDDNADLGLPPRSFAAPLSAALAEPEPHNVFDLDAKLTEESEAEVLEEGYSSLLELGRSAAPRQNFVRIEEAEDDSAQIEPVVIFPGHGARPGMRFAAPDAAYQASQAALAAASPIDVHAATGAPQLRRFDAPATTASPVSPAQTGGLRQDPEEAQRALRSALATLQRMSGAA